MSKNRNSFLENIVLVLNFPFLGPNQNGPLDIFLDESTNAGEVTEKKIRLALIHKKLLSLWGHLKMNIKMV